MFRAVLWKESREQAAVLVALLVLGGAAAAAAQQLSETGSARPNNPGEIVGISAGIAFLLLAVAAGTTIGGTLFAGEVEAGTDGLLNTLPATRRRLWGVKAAAGTVLTVAVGLALIGEVLLIVRVHEFHVAAVVALMFGFLVFGSFGWATVGSVRSKTALAACGIGVLCAAAAILPTVAFGLAVKAVLWEWFGGPKGTWDNVAVFLAVGAWAVFPLLLSRLLYVGPDWSRDDPVPVEEEIGRKRRKAVRSVRVGRVGFGAFALLWLVFRQWVVFVGVLAGVWLVLGLVMLADPVPMLTAWPVAMLFAGALVGAAGWADEQGRGAARFWGERRLPATRLWLAKATAGMALTLALGVVFLLPSAVRAEVNISRDGWMVVAPFPLLCARSGSVTSIAFYTFLWPVYGFAAGHLCGLLFRKAVVAFAMALLAGGAVAGLWFPSVYAGGLHFWQFAATPLAVVGTAGLLMRAWAADRLPAARPLAALVAGVVVALGATAGGLAYRAAEVPVIPESDDDLKLVKTLPKAEENQAGQDIRAGLTRLDQVPRELKYRDTAAWLYPDAPDVPSGSNVQPKFIMQIHDVGTRGYPAGRPDFDAWMDEMFADGWDAPMRAAAGKPLGTVENVPDMDWFFLLPLAQELRTAGVLMIARGLQKQAQGDPAVYPKYLDAALAASRNMRNKTIAICMMIGVAVEQFALSSVSTWLERLGDRPDLLREVRDILARHEATNPTDLRQTELAERTILRNMATNPGRWAGKFLQMNNQARDTRQFGERIQNETEAISFAWQVPWERERLARVVGLGNDWDRLPEAREYTRGGPLFSENFVQAEGWPAKFREREKDHQAARRAAMLLVTLRLFQAETGKPASGLEQLVPKYLAAVPADPFDGQPFRYRLSAGEWIVMETLDWQADATAIGPGMGGMSVTQGDSPDLIVGPPAGESGPPRADLTQQQFDAVAAAGGGLVRFPKPLPGPPGLEEFTAAGPWPAERAAEVGLGLVAAVAGGAVQWPLHPLAVERLTFAEIPGLPAREPLDRRRRWVEAGQGVLWSVAFDRADDGGKTLEERRGPQGMSFGDLIWVAPLPAK